MSEINLGEKFPELRLIQKLPGLWSINGCGFMLYGRRAYDEETGSYLQTHCLCFVFIPVLALAAYRVVPENGSKYFLGREPLSGLARGFNLIILLLGLGFGGYAVREHYITSPAYIARHQMAEAGRLERGGDHAKAAQLYAEVARDGPESPKAAALQKLDEMLRVDTTGVSAAEQSEVFLVVRRLHRDGRWPEPAEELYRRGMALVNDRARSDPGGAWMILDTVAPLAPREEDLGDLQTALLEQVVAKQPEDLEWRSRLAVVYEDRGQWEDCQALLDPQRDRLGTTEAARILGQIDARAGRLETALALLRPYVEARIERFRAAESELASAIEEAQERLISRLEAGHYDGFDIDRYQRADEMSQQTMLQQYVESRLRNDPSIRDAQDELIARASVVPVALDLGMLLLQRAQEQDDPEARAADLEEAEETLLAIGGLAGDQDEYKLNLGHVYYWQGRHLEGREQFDEVLASRGRDADTLLVVGGLLRDVGSASEARSLAEEAYERASEASLKQEAAILRGLLGKELDDQIDWLRKGNPTQPEVRALLGGSLAEQALRKGDEEAAIQHLRETLRIYDSMPETTATLNNAALILGRLAQLSRDEAGYNKALEKIERAIALNPSDSLALRNAAKFTLESSLRMLIGRSLDLTMLEQRAEPALLRYLYDDEEGRLEYTSRLSAHPGISRAESLYEKVLLLSPRQSSTYPTLAWLKDFRGDLDGQRALRARLEGIDLDVDDQIEAVKDLAAGKRTDQFRDDLTASVKRSEAILEESRARGLDVSFAVAAHDLLTAHLGLSIFGGEVDPDAMVALAEEAYAAAPSVGTCEDLCNALIHRAQVRLNGIEAAFAKLAEQVQGVVSGRELFMLAVSQEGPLREAVLDDSDVSRVVEILQRQASRTPRDVSTGFLWCLLVGKDPEGAAALARFYQEQESERLLREIRRRAAPASVSNALESYWLARMQGFEEEGAAILEEFSEQVMTLPVGLLEAGESSSVEQIDVIKSAEGKG